MRSPRRTMGGSRQSLLATVALVCAVMSGCGSGSKEPDNPDGTDSTSGDAAQQSSDSGDLVLGDPDAQNNSLEEGETPVLPPAP